MAQTWGEDLHHDHIAKFKLKNSQGRGMAQDIFIKFYGIDGESLDLMHKKEIEILSWRWAVGQTSNMHSGSGGGAGKSTVHDLQFEHYIDKSSPYLLQSCLTGKHIPEAVLTVRKAGGGTIGLSATYVTRTHHHPNSSSRLLPHAFSKRKNRSIFQSSEDGLHYAE